MFLLFSPNLRHPLTSYSLGDIVNVLGPFIFPATSSSTPLPTATIDGKANLLILHPDILITATALSNAPQCQRKPLLSTLVRSSSDVTPALVWGNILHEVMQTCLSEARWDEEFIDQKIDNVVYRSLGELLRINIGVEQTKREIKGKARGLQGFAEKYISKHPKVIQTLVYPWDVPFIFSQLVRSRRKEYQGKRWRDVSFSDIRTLRCRGGYLVAHLWSERQVGRVCPCCYH